MVEFSEDMDKLNSDTDQMYKDLKQKRIMTKKNRYGELDRLQLQVLNFGPEF